MSKLVTAVLVVIVAIIVLLVLGVACLVASRVGAGWLV